MTAIGENRELMSLVGRRNMATRWGHILPAAERADIERQITAIQVRRDLGKLAEKAAALPAKDRKGLAMFLAEQLGVAA